jgi:UDP-hydrolysing UDP-N-acetyl-D-glucosamine 2-epimerase
MDIRRIAVVTTSRADYSHLVWPLRELAARDNIDVQIIALAAHLSPEFGQTIDEIEADGFTVDERIECLLSSDSDVGMAKTIGVAVQSLADVLGRLRPDILLLIADRYEMLAPAAVAVALRIPMAHIEGGEVSEGAIDDAVRNALTKMSHVHFTPTELSRQRVLAMGEESWRVHRVGAPSLDNLRRAKLASAAELTERLSLDFHAAPLLVAYHPVTLAQDTVAEADEVFDALERLVSQWPIVFCFPNADAGSRQLIARAREFCERTQGSGARVYVNLDPVTFWSLLSQVAVLVGNSSCGIMEAPALALPCVNIGMRQRGRERAKNVIDVDPDSQAIVDGVACATSSQFRSSLVGMENPYGDGHAAKRIADVLADLPLGDKLLIKRAVDLAPAPPVPSL